MQVAHNMSQPAWVTSSVSDTLDELDAFNWDLESWTEQMVSLRAGELVRNVMLNFLHAILSSASASGSSAPSGSSGSSASELTALVPERKTDTQARSAPLEGAGSKFTMYSAHDSTVSWMLHALGVFNELQPPYACAVFLELYNQSGEFVVEAYFRNTTGSKQLYLLNMPSMQYAPK